MISLQWLFYECLSRYDSSKFSLKFSFIKGPWKNLIFLLLSSIIKFFHCSPQIFLSVIFFSSPHLHSFLPLTFILLFWRHLLQISNFSIFYTFFLLPSSFWRILPFFLWIIFSISILTSAWTQWTVYKNWVLHLCLLSGLDLFHDHFIFLRKSLDPEIAYSSVLFSGVEYYFLQLIKFLVDYSEIFFRTFSSWGFCYDPWLKNKNRENLFFSISWILHQIHYFLDFYDEMNRILFLACFILKKSKIQSFT